MKQHMWLFAFLFFIAPRAWSQTSDSDSFFQGVELQVGAEIPLQVGGRVRVLLPENFYVLAGLGISPQMFTDTIGSIDNAFGLMGSSTSKAAGQAIRNAFYLDLRTGYKVRMGSKFFNGFFVDVGYSLMAGSGGNISTNDINNLTGTVYPTGANADVKAVLHSLTGHMGFTFTIGKRFLLSTEAGLVKPLASVNTVSSNNISEPQASAMRQDVDSNLKSAIVSHMWIPTLSIFGSLMF